MNRTEVSVTAVIPTRNRLESLKRCLESLARQTYPIKEIIVVDASDTPITRQSLEVIARGLQVLHDTPSVCKQRNRGIQFATGTHILLCDDDIELPPDYVAVLTAHLLTNRNVAAISGTVAEPSPSGFRPAESASLSLPKLLWKFLFHLTVWADVNSIKTSAIGTIPMKLLKAYYNTKGNTFTPAGWPLLTQISGESLSVSLYGLGASIVRRDVLLATPFDETLDAHGIGDNYWIAINLPTPIVVLRTVMAYHHRSQKNRATITDAYQKRILALDYFMTKSRRFNAAHRVMLLWSLVGNLISQTSRLDFKRTHATLRAGFLILSRRNPYVVARRGK